MIKNNLIEKNHYNRLLTIYKNILSKQEAADMIDYYENDLSLSEIALNRNVSKNAVYLSIQQGKKKLDSIEDKLSLIEKLNKIIVDLEKIQKDNLSKEQENQLNMIIEEIKNGIWIINWKITINI